MYYNLKEDDDTEKKFKRINNWEVKKNFGKK
jgi:hypothetical protein